ncbi:hypothetical protein BDW74DRAFT_71014 [Aspergillus multicolor]|uniref:uncharacterized protein n=1 Tax=Aspergillus multicolor TaxID=41759 RepID=UPI003CCD8161
MVTMSSPGIDRSKKHITGIKPLLKKVSRDGSPSTSIDLSRPSFEQEGLGIYTNYERDSVQGDLYTNFPTRRKLSDLHRRSTSGTSQLSTASSASMSKQGPQYMHPMRRTPRAYTPPLMTHGQNYFDAQDTEADGQPRLSLHLPDTTFTPGGSQTNVTGRASFGYSRDNGSTLDTTSPTSRSSLDFIFRSRTRTSMDPVSRAATIQAARQAFEEKEAAKNRKFEEQRIKAEERQLKQKERQTTNMQEEKTSDAQSATQPTPNSENWKSQSKSTWMLFLTWLRTRIFKFRRRVRSLS